ncbi:hypothetical protein KR009_003039, partial [Drosophila setifemur]
KMRFFVEFLVVLLILEKSNAEIPNCDYYDTVPLSDDQRFENGSYLYKGLLIPAHLTGQYSFRVMPDKSKEFVENHWRGCACQLRPCIRFCCNYNKTSMEAKCNRNMEEEISHIHFYMNVTLKNGSVATLDFPRDLIGQTDLPNRGKDRFFSFDKNSYTMFEVRHPTFQWYLVHPNPRFIFQNGKVLRHSNKKIYRKRKYCFYSKRLCLAHLGFLGIYSQNLVILNIFFSSMVCLILTIGVYFYLNLVRTHHGKCFVCYLICIFTMNLSWFLNVFKFQNPCRSGYVNYFFSVASNIWLVIISLELRNAFRTRNSANLRFRVSSAFAWIIPAVLTGIIYLLDHTVDGNENWLPRLNGYRCWFNNGWSSLIYFFGPSVGMHLFNLTVFIQTTLRILAVKREITNLTDSQEGQQRLQSAIPTFFYLLRISVLMGVPWVARSLYYVFPNELSKWLYNFLTARGVIIFVLFVLKRSTLRLFCK